MDIFNYIKLKENNKVTLSKESNGDEIIYKATVKQYDFR